MSLNRNDLKKIIYDFNIISNRLMKVDCQEYLSTLKKFINRINADLIIHEYIVNCGEPSFDIAKEVAYVSESYGRAYFDLGETEQEEVANVYHLLKHIVDNNIEIHHRLILAYAIGSNKYQDKVKDFNERVVLVLIRYIESYLTKIGIDMGLDESVKYTITVNNGQVNVASDNSILNATVNNGINQKELKESIEAIISNISQDIAPEEQTAIYESIDVIESELTQPNPRKSLVRTALTTIKSVKGTIEFGAAVATLVQLVATVL